MVERFEKGPVNRTRGQPLGRGVESKLNNNHADDATARPNAPAVSADTPRLRAAFDRVPLLATLPEAARDGLWPNVTVHTSPPGTVLAAQGEPAGHLIVLLAGSVSAVAVTGHGRQVVTESWRAPAVLGKIAAFSGHMHAATLTATTVTAWCTVPMSVVGGVLAAHSRAGEHVARMLARAAHRAQHDFVATATGTVQARLAQWLLANARGTQVQLPGSQEQLAHRLGATRATINKVLHRLVKDGVIRLDGGGITILDHDRLAAADAIDTNT